MWEEGVEDAEFESPDLGHAAEASDGGVSGVGAEGFFEVVHHGMAVVGAVWEPPVGAVGAAAFDLFLDDGLDQSVHIDAAFEVFGFEEVAFRIMFGAAEVEEADAVCALFKHLDDVVVESAAEGAGAEADAVGGAVDHFQQILDILLVAEDAGESEHGEGGIVGMDDHAASALFGDGNDLGEEEPEVFLELRAVDVVVFGEHLADVFDGHALEAGEVVDDIGFEFLALGVGEGLVVFPGFFDGLGRAAAFRPVAFEDEDVEGDEGAAVEEESLGAVLEPVTEVGSHPVEHRHEVVGDDMDAAFGEVAEGYLVILDILKVSAAPALDVLVNGKALDHAPGETGILDHLLAFHDLIDRPYLSIGDVVEGADDAGGSGLKDVGQLYGVFRPVPSEGLFHEHDITAPIMENATGGKTAFRFNCYDFVITNI